MTSSQQTIGHIESVNDQEIVVKMTVEPDEMIGRNHAVHAGQVGTYTVIPQQDVDLLAMITAQRVRDPGRRAVDIPPEQTTVITMLVVGAIYQGKFQRGIGHYPVVGQEVRLASEDDLSTIFSNWDSSESQDHGQHQLICRQDPNSPREINRDHPASLSLGRFTPNKKYEVALDGKSFCARHSAILGSSGSGKSCTVAQVIQQAAAHPGTQTVIFDMHGEYLSAFCGDDGKVLPNVAQISGDELVLPYWLMKYEEMERLFLDRSNAADIPSQKGFLKHALLRLRGEAAQGLGLESVYTIDSPIYFSLDNFRRYANNLNAARFVLNSDRFAFRQTALRHLPPEEQESLMVESDVRFNLGNPEGEIPHPVYHNRLAGMVNLLEQKMSDRRYNFLLKPIAQSKRSKLFADMFHEDTNPAELSQCLKDLLALFTGQVTPHKNLVIVDLSCIPFETVDITVALLTRVLYEFNFWQNRQGRRPLFLVYEEAHNYIPADNPDSFARRAIERVAKEGRKYGVGILVVSQRPLEVSETVLSQCNSFIIMRMSNPADQAYVSKVVSEQFAGLVGTLAQLRPGEAYAVGEAVPMPMRTQVYLSKHAPDSADADFFHKDQTPGQSSHIETAIDSWWRQARPKDHAQEESSAQAGELTEALAARS